ncbi:MAG: DUF2304 domain-containing protein [Candidatus Moraniibacteriota bacterium]
MNLALYQIVILVIAGVMIYQGSAKFLKQQSGQSILKLSARVFIWGGMATIVLFPTVTNTLASLIGIADNINAVILTGFIFIFLMIFKLLSAIERLEQQITTVTREKSLEEISEIKN